MIYVCQYNKLGSRYLLIGFSGCRRKAFSDGSYPPLQTMRGMTVDVGAPIPLVIKQANILVHTILRFRCVVPLVIKPTMVSVFLQPCLEENTLLAGHRPL